MSGLMNKLYRVKRTELEMMQARGYDISAVAVLLKYSMEEFAKYYTGQMQKTGKNIYDLLSSLYVNSAGQYIYVFYSPEKDKATGKAIVTEVLNDINELRKSYNLDHAVIISAKGLSPEANSLMGRLPLYYIQSFTYSSLLWNITRHVLVDPHTLMTDKEVEEFLQKNRYISLDKMPIIKDTDAIAKFLGATPGQVIRIRRRITEYLSMSNVGLFYRYVKAEADIMGSV
ncbi:RNA polymerase II RPB5 subunit [Brazilian cedratvirus IHUMI]|uniref:RNA polymerase II RPB5 subunit n=1 Tax=Brazilian cedratvirus IHUMI TaxID=2126980 RepID=A0A2R8FE38_9VIRU|nr:RNA polymerase II RPB5 subunit [Brazilian cedratvirus IHUMI]